MSAVDNSPPLSPKEGWLSDGRQMLHFRPSLWTHSNQRLEVTSGELLTDRPVPLLKRRKEISRGEAIKLWRLKLREGWRAFPPQWRQR